MSIQKVIQGGGGVCGTPAFPVSYSSLSLSHLLPVVLIKVINYGSEIKYYRQNALRHTPLSGGLEALYCLSHWILPGPEPFLCPEPSSVSRGSDSVMVATWLS